MSLIAAFVARQIFGGDAEDDDGDDDGVKRNKKVEKMVESEVLDVWSDAYCNKHVLYAIVELVIVRVLPELGERGVRELLDERVRGGDGGRRGAVGDGRENRSL